MPIFMQDIQYQTYIYDELIHNTEKILLQITKIYLLTPFGVDIFCGLVYSICALEKITNE